MINTILAGQTIEHNAVVQISGESSVCIPVTDLNGNETKLNLNEEILSRHLMLLGNTGTGKTNVFDFILNDLRRNSTKKDVFLIFDSKGDFLRKHFIQGDLVLGNAKNVRKQSVVWNLFEEVLADGDNPEDIEINARELAKALFYDRGNQAQPFFSNSACDIFAHLIVYIVRKAQEDSGKYRKYLSNAGFCQILKKMTAQEYIQCFSAYEDMKGLVNYLGDAKNTQGLGVLGELKSMLNDYFVGIFEKESDNPFSIKNFVRERDRRAIFIEYDLSKGQVFEPIYRLLFDLALKEAMSVEETDIENSSGNVYLIADEFRMIPKLQHISDGLNFGRSKGVKIIAGIQSITQLEDIYGGPASKVMLAGFSSLIVFKCSDPASREYISERLGKNIVATDYVNIYDQTNTYVHEGYVAEDWVQNKLLNQKGNAVVSFADYDPFCVHFKKYENR